jgi:Domain of Unknown Function with PDB structure (DUF3857)/Transglutaminase-like superfamily
MRTVLYLAAFLLFSWSSFAGAAKQAPSWVEEAASVTLPNYNGTVPAAVLLEDQRVDVGPSGVLVARTRQVVKILTHDGRRYADAFIPYYRGGGRVRALHAWLIAPNGLVKSYEKNSIVDLGAHDEMELYSDLRISRIKVDNPEVGSVFAYEAEVEEKMLFAEDEYPFQSELPAIQSRYTLNLPPGWKAHSLVLHHEPLEPVISGSTYTWRLSNLPFRRHEEYSPELSSSVPVLAVSFAPNDAVGANNLNCFRSWADVSRWHTTLSAAQSDLSPEMTRKVQELTATKPDGYGRIRAIAQYVQKIKYVAIEMDVAHGGGYKPHAATLVFNKQYGDCKDKANLMRTMLKAAGIQSYLVAIYSGDRTYVRPEWPSPTQFNHMIIAVHVSDGLTGPTVIDAPTLKQHLLIFDPTSEATPLGDLPWYEQGSFALLMAGDKGDILQMPVLPPEANTTDLTIEAELAGSGALKARCVLREDGQYADHGRSLKLYRSPSDYRHHLEALFSESVRSAAVSNMAAEDLSDAGKYSIKAEIESSAYGQVMGGRLLVIGTALVAPRSPSFPAAGSRAEPIVLRSGLHRKHIRLKLPEGYKMDEMPASLDRQTPWARFSITFQQQPGELLIEESVRIEAVTLPAGQYQEVKKFFDLVYGADAQEVVLAKD